MTPFSSPPPFTLRPASYTDLRPISSLLTAAFYNDSLFGGIIHPHRAEYPADNELYWLRRAQVNYWDWEKRYIVSVIKREDGEEVITGVALWTRLGEGGERGMKLGRGDPRRLAKPLAQLSVSISASLRPNRAASPSHEQIIERSYPYTSHLWTGPRAESWYLECLGVSPEFQKQGHGRALVRWGFEQAEREGVCVSVVSGEGKEEFYRRCGFQVQEGWSGMGEGNPLGVAPGGLVFWRDVGGEGEGKDGDGDGDGDERK